MRDKTLLIGGAVDERDVIALEDAYKIRLEKSAEEFTEGPSCLPTLPIAAPPL